MPHNLYSIINIYSRLKGMKYIFLFVLTLSFITLMFPSLDASTNISPSHNNSIFTINSISEISLDHQLGTIVFFDLDDTLFDSPVMLGSKAWRRYISKVAPKWHDTLSLFLLRNLQVELVEQKTLEIIESLKLNGSITNGLTARERKIWYTTPVDGIDELTVSQVISLNIDFSIESLNLTYPELKGDPEFYQGIFFCNTDLKGDYLKKIIEAMIEKPIKIVFIDDKLSQVESVAKALKELTIQHECYWYTATDEKALKFDPLIANIQLYYFLISSGTVLISDEEAAIIAKKTPGQNTDFYLKAILKTYSDHSLSN